MTKVSSRPKPRKSNPDEPQEILENFLEDQECLDAITEMVFSRIDADHNGVISLEELREFFDTESPIAIDEGSTLVDDTFSLITQDDSSNDISLIKMRDFMKRMFQNQLKVLKSEESTD